MVKVRQEQYEEDEHEGDVRDLGLKTFLSLSLHSGSSSPVKDQKVVFMPSIVRVPKCYVPHAPIPRASVTEDFEDSSLTSDYSESVEPEKDGSTDENKVNIRASLIPRPRAVISSPG
ncbi:hypothetical protein SESBI_48366 [Sesbania bispinosa]|nr:hypothetical protein SESBI_48366 [Sesbania bispinosa]